MATIERRWFISVAALPLVVKSKKTKAFEGLALLTPHDFMKKIFVYNCEILNSELLVCVGENIKEVEKWYKKNSKNLTEILKNKDNKKFLEDCLKLNIVFYFQKDDLDYWVLSLKDFKNDWYYLDVLNHEVRHYCQGQFKNREINEEKEFEAYFQESVFRELRQKLNKFIK